MGQIEENGKVAEGGGRISVVLNGIYHIETEINLPCDF